MVVGNGKVRATLLILGRLEKTMSRLTERRLIGGKVQRRSDRTVRCKKKATPRGMSRQTCHSQEHKREDLEGEMEERMSKGAKT